MPVITRCPMCRGVMSPADHEARCPRCGETVIPAARKLCAHCGQDCTNSKRVKSEAGEYYCQGCWDELAEASGRPPGYQCWSCRKLFRIEEVSQCREGIICRSCRAARGSAANEPDPDTLLVIAAEMSPGEVALFDPGPMPVMKKPMFSKRQIAWAICAGVVVLALFAFAALRT